MPADETTAEKMKRTIDARYEVFKDAVDKAIEVYGQCLPETNQRKAFANVLTAGQNLFDLFAEQDRPRWLGPILGQAREYSIHSNGSMAASLHKAILNNYRDIAPIQLLDDQSEYDFDALFERLRQKHELPELFDRLAKELAKIIESGEVDSLATVTALHKMIAALKANRTGSQTSMEVSFNYVRFGWHYMVEMLNLIPGIKQYTTAIDKTIAEGKGKMKAMRDDLQEETLQTLLTGVQNIQKIPQAKPLRLTSGTNEDIIEGEFTITRPKDGA